MPRGLVAQFRKPSGPLGHLAGWIMTRPSRRRRSQWTVSLLEIAPEHRVLEIGFGPGLAIECAAQLAVRGKVVGVDHSEVMHRVASRRNRAAIRAGRVELHCTEVDKLPAFDAPFDRIYTINCLMFWPEPATRLRALCELLAPGGRLAVTQQPRKPGADERDVERAGEELRALLEGAGLCGVELMRLPLEPVAAICAIGRRAA